MTNARTSRLVAQGWNSQQQGDQDRLHFASQTAALAVARANVVAQQAVVNRLVQLTGFEQITAPFDGVITGRFIDVGSLVTADVASGTPLFSIARTDVLRVQVYVPQAAFFGIRDGDVATVTVPELPDRAFNGKVARNARALAAGTRTLLTEVDVDNKDGTLTAGLYGIVHLQVRRPNPVVLIPSQAVIFNKDGLSAAVVSGGKVELRKLDLESDNGADVEVRTGLRPGDRVIVSPPTNVRDGMRIQADARKASVSGPANGTNVEPSAAIQKAVQTQMEGRSLFSTPKSLPLGILGGALAAGAPGGRGSMEAGDDKVAQMGHRPNPASLLSSPG